jgi:hypothetical protein
MTEKETPFCSICLEPRNEEDGWFLLTENSWTDRLKILGWNDTLVSEPGVHAACGAAHVQQLVVHWMATGSLNYPFARSHIGERTRRKRPHQPEIDIRGAKVIGELAVHRESLSRVLRENPESLGSILSALISALDGSRPATDCEEEAEAAEVLELTEV